MIFLFIWLVTINAAKSNNKMGISKTTGPALVWSMLNMSTAKPVKKTAIAP
jgi:hypothetical protein